MVIQFASTIYLIKLDNNLVIVYDGIFETFGSKIRDEIPKEVAPVRTN